jgi:cytochrome c oxidase cbb3-type subunit 1
MIGRLTKNERQLALVILCVVAVLGLLMMAAGRNDPFGAQGGLVALMALFAIFGVISGYFSPDRARAGPPSRH